MSEVQELIEAIEAAEVTLRVKGENIVIEPASKVPAEVKAQLNERKAAVLRRLELEQSMRRLEAARICIAVWEDGSMRVVVFENDTLQAIDDGGTIYSPRDLFMYVT